MLIIIKFRKLMRAVQRVKRQSPSEQIHPHPLPAPSRILVARSAHSFSSGSRTTRIDHLATPLSLTRPTWREWSDPSTSIPHLANSDVGHDATSSDTASYGVWSGSDCVFRTDDGRQRESEWTEREEGELASCLHACRGGTMRCLSLHPCCHIMPLQYIFISAHHLCIATLSNVDWIARCWCWAEVTSSTFHGARFINDVIQNLLSAVIVGIQRMIEKMGLLQNILAMFPRQLIPFL